jgi:hypothetical protein
LPTLPARPEKGAKWGEKAKSLTVRIKRLQYNRVLGDF